MSVIGTPSFCAAFAAAHEECGLNTFVSISDVTITPNTYCFSCYSYQQLIPLDRLNMPNILVIVCSFFMQTDLLLLLNNTSG